MRTSCKDVGKSMYGRILSYDRTKGYGFIRTEDGSDLFVSSYGFGKNERKAVIGAYVKFTVAEKNGKAVAEGVSIVQKFKDGISRIGLPNEMFMPIKNIIKFGRSNGLEEIEKIGVTAADLKEHGYEVKDLDYVYIETPAGPYNFYREGGPVRGDGQVNVESFFSSLKEQLHAVKKEDMDQIKESDRNTFKDAVPSEDECISTAS